MNTGISIGQITLLLGVLLALVKPLGAYMARVYTGRAPFLGRWLEPLERGLYRLAGIRPEEEMSWSAYAMALLIFNALGLAAVYTLLQLQGILPFNPQHVNALSWDQALNTAISFVTNTNWQSYSGEVALSYFSQMIALTVQNFMSAATGMGALLALSRGFARRSAQTVGNFWVDVVRGTLHILLPLACLWTLVLVSQGVVQTFRPAQAVTLLQPDGVPGQAVTQQVIAIGPAASQVAIKQLGTNGGGFFNTNSAHPLENPTPLSNFVELLAILLLPAALCYSFGIIVGDTRQGWTLLAAMLVLFVALLGLTVVAEQAGNPALTALGVAPGGNMEGKETRLGVLNSALWAVATTAASNGSVNAMHTSYTPLGALGPLLLIQLGEVVFGGVGSGLYGMLSFALVTVFVSGLMVGRAPEYLGKKIEVFEMKMAALVILLPAAAVLIGTAVAVLLPAGQASILNPGPRGFTEVLYAFSSAANNNGSAFAGLNANTPFYNLALGLAMLIGRYGPLLSILAVAGSLARKKITPVGPGTLPTHTPLFVILLVGIVFIVGALTFIPALALGPIAEQLQMLP